MVWMGVWKGGACVQGGMCEEVGGVGGVGVERGGVRAGGMCEEVGGGVEGGGGAACRGAS